jgi:hypothetical protein
MEWLCEDDFILVFEEEVIKPFREMLLGYFVYLWDGFIEMGELGFDGLVGAIFC